MNIYDLIVVAVPVAAITLGILAYRAWVSGRFPR